MILFHVNTTTGRRVINTFLLHVPVKIATLQLRVKKGRHSKFDVTTDITHDVLPAIISPHGIIERQRYF